MSSGLINLHSEEGQILLREAQNPEKGCIQPFLGEVFCKQKGGYSCGIQSCALLISAAQKGSSKDGKPSITEDDLLKTPAVEKVLSTSLYSTGEGLTLEEAYRVLIQCGHKAEVVFASESSVDEMRSKILKCLGDPNSQSGVIVNYHMETLGQDAPYGHHSPLGGYHKATDRVLIYDCWPATHECWTSVENLFNAMLGVDSTSKKSRGFILINQFAQL